MGAHGKQRQKPDLRAALLHAFAVEPGEWELVTLQGRAMEVVNSVPLSEAECMAATLRVVNEGPWVLREFECKSAFDPETGHTHEDYVAFATFQVGPGAGAAPTVEPNAVRYALVAYYRDGKGYSQIAKELEALDFKPARAEHWRLTSAKALIHSQHGQRMRHEMVAAGELPKDLSTRNSKAERRR